MKGFCSHRLSHIYEQLFSNIRHCSHHDTRVIKTFANSVRKQCSAGVNTPLGERYKLRSYSLWNYIQSSLMGPNIHPRVLFSNTLSLLSSLNIRDQLKFINIYTSHGNHFVPYNSTLQIHNSHGSAGNIVALRGFLYLFEHGGSLLHSQGQKRVKRGQGGLKLKYISIYQNKNKYFLRLWYS